tara:strand:+ start:271 stop:516 length:246 start_codon:yes stop_codon:yes gene_type:complete
MKPKISFEIVEVTPKRKTVSAARRGVNRSKIAGTWCTWIPEKAVPPSEYATRSIQRDRVCAAILSVQTASFSGFGEVVCRE